MEAFGRREFLVRAGQLGLALGAGGFLAACSTDSSSSTTASSATTGTTTTTTPGPPARRALREPTAAELRQLSSELSGQVVTPGDAAYANGRLPYDTLYDNVRPQAIAYCESTEDVERAVSWAARHDIRIAARCGGHSYGGYSTTRGVIVDVTRMKRVNVGDGVATVGAGTLLIDLYSKLWRRRVTVPGGSCPTVGISGLALGGGVGLSGRKFGTTADNIRELTIVTADGEALTCSASQNEDLYWACRGGGGGNFGIVTSFVFDTHPVDEVTTYFVEFPWSRAAQVVRAWLRLPANAPDGLFALCNLSSTGNPSQQPSVSSAGQFYGSEAQLRSLLAPLLEAGGGAEPSIVRRSYLDAVLYWAGCSGDSVAECHLAPQGGLQRTAFKGKSSYVLEPIPRAGMRALLGGIEARQRQGGGGGVILDSYGGAINKVDADATAFVHRDALCSIQYFVTWPTSAGASVANENIRWINGYYNTVRPHISRFAYQNYIDPDLADWKQAYYGSNLSRLVSIKQQYDSGDLFRFRQSIPTRL